jgi:hypothetical protein
LSQDVSTKSVSAFRSWLFDACAVLLIGLRFSFDSAQFWPLASSPSRKSQRKRKNDEKNEKQSKGSSTCLSLVSWSLFYAVSEWPKSCSPTRITIPHNMMTKVHLASYFFFFFLFRNVFGHFPPFQSAR